MIPAASQRGARKRACIVLPTYNEAENVRALVPQIFAEAARIESHELHVLVVDDGSPDGTQDAVRGLMERYPRLHLATGEKRGLGDAYQRGFALALRDLRPDLVLQMDADLQHPPALLPLFVTLADHGFSLVIGSRFAPGGGTPRFSRRRKLISALGNWLIRFLGGLPRLHDCTSGFRCIQADILRRCDLSFLATRGYSFQTSLLFELLRNGARPIEVPMIFGTRIHGESKLSLRDQLEFLANVFRIRFRRSEEFVKFCAVGASGVAVNTGMLVGLRHAGLPLEAASALAIEAAVLSNFALHSGWTFRSRRTGRSLAGRLARFHVVSGAAALVNFLLLLLLVRGFHVWYVLANLAGIAAATLVNYAMNSRWTWKDADADRASVPLHLPPRRGLAPEATVAAAPDEASA